MNLYMPEVQLVTEPNPELKLERCIRVCYKSEDKICEGSAARIIKVIALRGHLSTLEHYRIRILCTDTVVEKIKKFQLDNGTSFIRVFNSSDSNIRVFDSNDSKYSHVLDGNLRAFYELANHSNLCSTVKFPILQCLHQVIPSMVNDWTTTATRIDFDCVKLLGESPDYFTVRIISDRGVLGQFTRHRILSPSVESTRNCNYTKKGMAMCIPYPFLWAPCKSMDEWILQVTDYWMNDPDFDTKYKDNYISEDGNVLHNGIVEIANLAKLQAYWEMTCGVSELGYNLMSRFGASPQEARTVLPLSLKTEFVMTGTIDAWNHFIKLRDASDADPQIRILAEKINDIKNNFIKKENK